MDHLHGYSIMIVNNLLHFDCRGEYIQSKWFNLCTEGFATNLIQIYEYFFMIIVVVNGVINI